MTRLRETAARRESVGVGVNWFEWCLLLAVVAAATAGFRGRVLQPRAAAGPAGSRATPSRLFVRLEQSFTGPPALIVSTLEDVATLLQEEVDAGRRAYDEAPRARPVDASTFLSTISARFQMLAEAFGDAEPAFAAASSPSGSPRMLQSAYGRLLAQQLSARRALRAIEAPPMFARTQAAARDYVDSMCRQIEAWPEQTRRAAAAVSSDRYDLVLSATFDMAAFENALAADTPA